MSGLPQTLNLCFQATTYSISGNSTVGVLFCFVFSVQYHFSFKWSASLYQSLGCLWISIQKLLSLHEVHPALGQKGEMIIRQIAVSLLEGSGKGKKQQREHQMERTVQNEVT